MTENSTLNRLFPGATPESCGIPSQAILDFMDRFEQEGIELHSFSIFRGGRQIAAAHAKPFEAESLHRLQSAGKTVVGLAVLFCVQEGRIGLEDRVTQYLTEYLPPDMDEKFTRLTLYDLLTMRSGHAKDTFHEMQCTDNWNREFFSLPLDYEPGTHWVYNNGIPHVLATLVEKVSGQILPEYLKPRFLDPLGIHMTYGFNQQGEYDPAVTCLSPASFAKFTLFFLQKGQWEGKQLLRADLVEMSGKALVPNWDNDRTDADSHCGYGFQIWHNEVGGFRIAGGGGQYGLIYPEKDMAVVTMAFTPVKYNLIPSFVKETFYFKAQEKPLPEDPKTYAQLQDRIQRFSLVSRFGTSQSSTGRAVDGKTFTFGENSLGLESIALHLQDPGFAQITARQNGALLSARAGYQGEWLAVEGEGFVVENDYSVFSRIFETDTNQTLLSAWWKDEFTFQVNIRSMASMGGGSLIFDFRRNRLVLTCIPARLNGRNPRTMARKAYKFEPIILEAQETYEA